MPHSTPVEKRPPRWQRLLVSCIALTAAAQGNREHTPIKTRASPQQRVRMDWAKRRDGLTARQFLRRYRIDKEGLGL